MGITDGNFSEVNSVKTSSSLKSPNKSSRSEASVLSNSASCSPSWKNENPQKGLKFAAQTKSSAANKKTRSGNCRVADKVVAAPVTTEATIAGVVSSLVASCGDAGSLDGAGSSDAFLAAVGRLHTLLLGPGKLSRYSIKLKARKFYGWNIWKRFLVFYSSISTLP